MDGVGGLTQAPVPTGGHFDYVIPSLDPGTYLLRPCILGASAEPAARGLNGLVVVAEDKPPAIDLDLTFVIDDWLLTEEGGLAPFQNPSVGRLGNWITVNGKPLPAAIQAPQGSRVRLRLANASNARFMPLGFEGLKPFVAAIDGQPTDNFEPLRAQLPFAPGTRYDLLVDMPEAGSTGMVRALIGQGLTLIALKSVGEPASIKGAIGPPLSPLPANPALPAAISLQSAQRKDVVIAPDGDQTFTLNGLPGNLQTPLLDAKVGEPIVLTLRNDTDRPQPLHLHGHKFRLLHPFDDGWDPYFLDTVQIPEKRVVRIAFNAEFPGRWLLASTVLERFDGGLWTWFEVG